MQRILLISSLVLACLVVNAQSHESLVRTYLSIHQKDLKLSESDVQGFRVSDQYLTKHNQVTHIYLQQTYQGIDVFGAVSSAAIKDGKVALFNPRVISNLAQMVNTSTPSISMEQAVLAALEHLEIEVSNLRSRTEKANEFFGESPKLRADIKVTPIYQPYADAVYLAWNVEVRNGSDWWNVRVDALTGEYITKNNYTVYCKFDDKGFCGKHNHLKAYTETAEDSPKGEAMVPGYRVVPFPFESPVHGARQLLNNPADPTASPFGWHDTDGVAGPEYTITRGNNVYASEDRAGTDTPGYSPDGGSALLFDYPYNPALPALDWQDAAITNLFYANNYLHDITYRMGFDEAAGNFQETNFTGAGQAQDPVLADAQDGSGTNNANFSTPPDGASGRMQMYIWTGGGSGGILTVQSPAGIAGTYTAVAAGFGGTTPPNGLNGQLELVIDGTIPFNDGCETITNAADLNGNIAVVDRGTCTFVAKCLAAQQAGAVAVMVCNNAATAPIAMGGTGSAGITVPCFMVSQADCNRIKVQLNAGSIIPVNYGDGGAGERDSDMDNGIMAHEFGHGVSNRLTGGPSAAGCLGNAEQMGEGWSDWLAMLLLMKPNDVGATGIGIGNYANGDPITAAGIRNQLYSNNMTVNTYTYGDLPATNGEVHNIGEIWATVLWDMTWALVDSLGFDANFAPTSGNAVALRLVLDGMKLQPCSPGFVDGRDGILQADQLSNGGAYQCLIWRAFARRGLGYSASQGSSDNFTDGVEAFDLPPNCLIASLAPVAAFTVDQTTACLGLATFSFTDQTTNIAQSWAWNFGDGVTTTLQNPTHTYTTAGIFTVGLTVTNNIGTDIEVRNALISVSNLPSPSAQGASICAGQTANLTANINAPNIAQWLDASGNIVSTGATFTTPALSATTNYQVREAENKPILNVGPTTNTFGTGGNHNTTFEGKLLFTALKPFTLKSVLMIAQGAGPRVVTLYDANNTVVQQVTVTVPVGANRVNLNLEIPTPGNYSIGNAAQNLYRNNGGAQYPYTLPGIVSITASNATNSSATFYYYFYAWEVQEKPCTSPVTSVTVNVNPAPVATFSSSNVGLAYSFTPQNSTAASYSWNFGDGSTASSATSPQHSYAANGSYSVTLCTSGANGCSACNTQVISVVSGLFDAPEAAFRVSLMPNPTQAGQTVLSLSGNWTAEENMTARIFAADGRLVQVLSINAERTALDMGSYPTGIYFVQVSGEHGMATQRIVHTK